MADLRDKIRSREAPKGPAKKAGSKPPARKGPAPGLPGLPAMPALDVNRKLLLAAGGIAGLAALVAVMYLSDLSAGIAGQGAKTPVWVVKEGLPARHEIVADDLDKKEFPRALLAEGYLGADDKILGKITLVDLAKGEVLLKSRVAMPGAATGAAPKLRPNERGFVYVPDGLQEVPLVKPDDTVDLIASLPEPGDTKRVISTPVLQSVRVIAVGDRFSPDATESVSGNNSAITLAVPMSKISLLTILKQAGNLNFALRAPGDTQTAPTRISEAELERMVMGQVPRPVVHHEAPPPRPRTIVRVVRERPVSRPAPVVRHEAPRPAPVHQAPHIEIYNGAQKQN